MIGQVVTFDGHRLNDLFFVGEVAAGLPEWSPTVVDRSGNGATVTGTRTGTAQVSVRLVAKPVAGKHPRESIAKLLAWLDVDGPKWLTLSDDDGLKRLVIPTGSPTVDDTEYNDNIVVAFEQVEPCLFGASRSASLASASSASLTVGGTHPTRPTITAAAAIRDSTTGLWGVSFDNDAYVLRVPLPTALQTAVSIDCDSRAVLVDGEVSNITLESDWPELAAGTHTVAMDLGTGAASLAWVERWHR